MKVEFPLLILGYSPNRVFSIEDEDGHARFPVFYDAEKAEAFRVFFEREHQQVLEAYLIADVKAALPFFQFLLTADPRLEEVCIDAPPPVDGKKGGHCLRFTKFVETLQHQFQKHLRRRRQKRRSQQPRRMGGNARPIRTKPV